MTPKPALQQITSAEFVSLRSDRGLAADHRPRRLHRRRRGRRDGIPRLQSEELLAGAPARLQERTRCASRRSRPTASATFLFMVHGPTTRCILLRPRERLRRPSSHPEQNLVLPRPARGPSRFRQEVRSRCRRVMLHVLRRSCCSLSASACETRRGFQEAGRRNWVRIPNQPGAGRRLGAAPPAARVRPRGLGHLGRRDRALQVDIDVNSTVPQEVYQVFSGDVPAGARGEGAPTRPARPRHPAG